MKPPRSILDPRFKYRNASQTDVAKTFDKYRRLLRMQQRQQDRQPALHIVKKVANGQ